MQPDYHTATPDNYQQHDPVPRPATHLHRPAGRGRRRAARPRRLGPAPPASPLERLVDLAAFGLLLALLADLRYGRDRGDDQHRQQGRQQHQLLHVPPPLSCFQPSCFGAILQYGTESVQYAPLIYVDNISKYSTQGELLLRSTTLDLCFSVRLDRI